MNIYNLHNFHGQNTTYSFNLFEISANVYIFCHICKFCIGNRFNKSICLFLNPIVQLLLFCLYISVIPIKYVYTKRKCILMDT